MPYPEQMVAPMRAEIVEMGVQELRTISEVEDFFAVKEGTSLLLINSVCGCAAGSARPALRMALDHDLRPAQQSFGGPDEGWEIGSFCSPPPDRGPEDRSGRRQSRRSLQCLLLLIADQRSEGQQGEGDAWIINITAKKAPRGAF